MSDGDGRPDPVSAALEEATTAMRRAVEAQRSTTTEVSPLRTRENQLHELRSLLTTMASMIRAFDLSDLLGQVEWRNPYEAGSDTKPSHALQKASDDLQAAGTDLSGAAAHLTAARRTVAELR